MVPDASKSDKESSSEQTDDDETNQVHSQTNDEIDSDASTTNDSINTTFILDTVNEEANIDKLSEQKRTEL